MATTLLVMGAIWAGLSLLFCLALCVAAAKPLPTLEAQEEFNEPEHQPIHAVDEDALCVK